MDCIPYLVCGKGTVSPNCFAIAAHAHAGLREGEPSSLFDKVFSNAMAIAITRTKVSGLEIGGGGRALPLHAQRCWGKTGG